MGNARDAEESPFPNISPNPNCVLFKLQSYSMGFEHSPRKDLAPVGFLDF